MIKYLKEIDELLEAMCADWMDGQEKAEFKKIILSATGAFKQSLSDDIQKGVDNGYSVKSQMELAKKIFYGFDHNHLLNTLKQRAK